MKTNLILTACLCLIAATAFAQTPVVGTLSEEIQAKTKSLNPRYLVYSPKDQPKEPAPLLIYLHGAGGVGEDIQKIRGQVTPLWAGIEKFGKGPCIVVAPQCNKRVRDGGGWRPGDLNLALEHWKATLEIDETRIYLTGNSMGGFGSWIWGGTSPQHFAAVAPISGGIGPGGPKDVTDNLGTWAANLAKVPVYAFAGAKDRVVPAQRSQQMIDLIEQAGGKSARIKIYPDEGHNARRVVFTTTEFYDWMFSQRRK